MGKGAQPFRIVVEIHMCSEGRTNQKIAPQLVSTVEIISSHNVIIIPSHNFASICNISLHIIFSHKPLIHFHITLSHTILLAVVIISSHNVVIIASHNADFMIIPQAFFLDLWKI